MPESEKAAISQAPAYMIEHTSLPAWVEGLLAQAQVIAPRATQAQEVGYDIVESADQVAWGYGSSFVPLKRFLFPQTERLFRWRQAGGALRLEPTYDLRERIFLAARPCDVSGVLFLDRVFSRDREDVYYLTRRDRATLIALTCEQPGENCFCVCAHAGPFLEAGYDLQLTRLGERYLVEVGSEKGASLIRRSQWLFAPAPEEALRERHQLAREAEVRFGEEKAYFAAALRKVTFDRVSDALWQQMGDLCLSCGACAFVCPTCSCFTTADSGGRDEGARDRLWDSCSYQAYTLEASGHNPRALRMHRLKARFFHKLSYQFLRRNGAHGCVGCGRCVTACLGLNDMPSVTARIRRGLVADLASAVAEGSTAPVPAGVR